MGCVFSNRGTMWTRKRTDLCGNTTTTKWRFTASNGFTRQTFRSGPSKDCEDLCNECSKTRK